MTLTAIVWSVTTETRLLPGNPQVDVVYLSCKGSLYVVETPVGKLEAGQEVEVEAARLNANSAPYSLRLRG